MMEERIRWFYENENNFTPESKELVLNSIKACSDSDFEKVRKLKIKNPSKTLIYSLSYFFGLDRFYLKSTFMGILKLLTCGGFFILGFVDIVTAKKRTYIYNLKKVLSITAPAIVDDVVSANSADMYKKAAKSLDVAYKVVDAYDDMITTPTNTTTTRH